MNITRSSKIGHFFLKITGSIAASMVCTMCAAQTLPGTLSTTWLGNSFPGTPNQLHVQDNIQGMYVAPNGTCYTDSIWDEGGNEAGFYSNGAFAGSCVDTHGWGRIGGQAVTSDGTYVYVAIAQTTQGGSLIGSTNANGEPEFPPNSSTIWFGVARYTLTGAAAPFATGYGPDCDELVVTTNGVANGGDNSITGLAYYGGTLYVADNTDSEIKLYNTGAFSQTPGTSWGGYGGLGAMAFDGYGNLWGLIYSGSTYLAYGASASGQGFTGGTSCNLDCLYAPGGHTGTGSITFASADHPMGLAYNASTGLFMVTDQGPDQNIKCYNPTSFSGSPTTIASTIGATGGIFSGTAGQVGSLKFNMPSGVGADSSGNIYVSEDGTCQDGGGALDAYTSAGVHKWSLYGLEWIDDAGIDPGSEGDVYTHQHRFSMNWGYTVPGAEWTYSDYTINPFAFPEDPRLHLPNVGAEGAAVMRRIDGSLFMFVPDQYDTFLSVFRFNSSTNGAIAIPSGLFAQGNRAADRTGWPENEPASGEWIWRDSNGNGTMDSGEYNQPTGGGSADSWGWWVDSNGDVWQATQFNGIRHSACQGLDSYGNPIYNYAHMTTIAMPSQFNDLERIEYFPATDTMYLTGYNATYPDIDGIWGTIGRVIYRYDNWSTTPTVHTGYPIIPTFNATSSPQVLPQDISIAGSYAFVDYSQQNWMYVFNLATGATVGLITPGADIGGNASVTAGTTNCLGWSDMRFALQAYQRSSGEYDITQEDDWLGKVVIYRWSPTAPLANGTYSLTPACATASRLDATSSGTSNGTNVEIWGSNGGSNQEWIFTNAGGNLYTIESAYAPNMCLDVASAGTTNGTNVDIYQANGTNAQLWALTAVTGGYTLTPQCATGLRLDVSGAGSANGTNVQIYSSNSTSAQTWAIAPE